MNNAIRNINKYLKPTPLTYNKRLSDTYGCNVYLKREDLQEVRSFKIRGALNKILYETYKKNYKNIVCASAGNHAQGVAYSGKLLDINTHIFVPEVTPLQKYERIEHFGGKNCNIYKFGTNFDECLEKAMEFSSNNDSLFVHPFDDINVINGQGTIGSEICKKINPDIMLASIGGGGLVSGLLSFKKYSNKVYDVFGVEPCDAASMKVSLLNNGVCTLDKIDTFVDGASVKTVGKSTFDICKKHSLKTFTASNGRICNEMISLYQEDGIIAEPAGALSICGLDNLEKKSIEGKNVICILSGGNNDMLRYPEILDKNMRYLKLKHYFIINFSQQKGELKIFMEKILPKGTDITRFEYIKKNNKNSGSVLLGIEVDTPNKINILTNNMHKYNFNYIEINENDLLYSFLI